MAALADLDFDNARIIVQLEREDLIEGLNRTLNPFLHPTEEQIIRSRLAALTVHDGNLRRAEARIIGRRIRPTANAAVQGRITNIPEARNEELEDVEATEADVRVNATPTPQVPGTAVGQPTDAESANRRATNIQAIEVQANEASSAANTTKVATAAAKPSGGTASGVVEGYEVTLSLATARNILSDPALFVGAVERLVETIGVLPETNPRVECVVCTETHFASQTVTLPCNDRWCRTCIRTQFEGATVNEGVWPPKCCRQDIALEAVSFLLNRDLRLRFITKSAEYSTTNRTYCYDINCRTFIHPDNIQGRLAPCEYWHETCAQCKGSYHEQPQCPDVVTEHDRMLEDMARENGWPRCPNCRRYVEITQGCNHMT